MDPFAGKNAATLDDAKYLISFFPRPKVRKIDPAVIDKDLPGRDPLPDHTAPGHPAENHDVICGCKFGVLLVDKPGGGS